MQATPHRRAIAPALAAAEARYRAAHPVSAQRQAAAERDMPGGNTRSALHYSPFPLAFARGSGNRLTDVDGREYLDLLGDYSAGLYGHSDPLIQAAIKKAVDEGMTLGGPNAYEAPLAAAIKARFPSIELIRFTNSGTEANLMALSAVRALDRGRSRIMVFEGGYHGGVFYFRGGSSPLNAPFDWLIGSYNDLAGTRALLREHAACLAAVLVEPMQGGACVAGSPEFLRMLREESSASGAVLIFDEVMTSRLSPAGLQGALGIRPDMTTLGKYLGGGASFGAFGGSREIMKLFDPLQARSFEHAGTFNNNVLSMAAGLAGLTHVCTPQALSRLNRLGEALRSELNRLGTAHGAAFRADGIGSLMTLKLADPALQALFHLEMLGRGYYFARRGYIALSLPTTQADCEAFADAVDGFLREYRPLLEIDR